MDICIRYQAVDNGDGTTTTSWPWNVEGGLLSLAIAVVERVKQSVYTWQHDPFEKMEPDQKVCIHYDEEKDEIGVSIRNLTTMQALEGLCEVQYTMQEAWFGKAQPVLVEG